jgi:glycosyltransferase involved in cell wall biosynthesis
MRECYQVNLQTAPGGGEIFTRFFTAALTALGWRTVLVTAADAAFWPELAIGAETRPIHRGDELLEVLPPSGAVVITHNVLGAGLSGRVAARHTLAGLVHMPFYGRDPSGLFAYRRLFAVSNHVRASLAAAGLTNVHDEPLYGVADLRPRSSAGGRLSPRSEYEWDQRKFRDRLLGVLEPVVRTIFPKPAFDLPAGGIRLGIVSRLTPIKQFPELFHVIAPVIAARPAFSLDIFGSGGYASVRDLKRSLSLLKGRVRFWGAQSDVASAYRAVDFVLSGLPEKEALGLNLLEAQVIGTPVLAVDAPPFTETVRDGVTGHLFADPRRDAGLAFAALLDRLSSGTATLDRSAAPAHLAMFGEAAFRERVGRALNAISAPLATRAGT